MNRRNSILLAVIFGAIFIFFGKAQLNSWPGEDKNKVSAFRVAGKKKADKKTLKGKVMKIAGPELSSYVDVTIRHDDGTQSVAVVDISTKSGPTIFNMINQAAGNKLKVSLTIKGRFVTFAVVNFSSDDL